MIVRSLNTRWAAIGTFILSLTVMGLIPGGQARGQESFVHTNRESPVTRERPDTKEMFTFGIFGDQTGTHDPVATLKVLEYAIGEMNLLGPDLVMTVGDMINGYNQREQWLAEMGDFMRVMNALDMPWFPVAGNHDVYWRGEGRPENEHDADYERYFGPLWYAFEHKGCWFVALYSDEGDPETGEKNFSKAASQVMSPQQTRWLKDTLKKAERAPHVFLFLHHPRWTGGHYGDDWDRIHTLLKEAGNVSVVFAGHTHRMKYNGKRDGIEYFTLGTTGGAMNEHNPARGLQHHYDLVTVRGDEVHVTAVPVGSAIDPRVNRVETQVLTAWEDWSIKSDAQRVKSWSIQVPDFQGGRGELRVGVQNAWDESGDEGVYYTLMDTQHRSVSSGFFSGKGTEWVKYAVKPKQRFFFTLSDHDTELAGEHPGNDGRLQIELDIVRHEFQDPTRKN
jgi:predicted phosphodiesterase